MKRRDRYEFSMSSQNSEKNRLIRAENKISPVVGMTVRCHSDHEVDLELLPLGERLKFPDTLLAGLVLHYLLLPFSCPVGPNDVSKRLKNKTKNELHLIFEFV